VLEAEGRAELQPELRRLTKEGRWYEIGRLIDDDLLSRIAAVGTPREVAAILRARYGHMAQRLAVASPFPLSQRCASELVDELRAPAKPA
jgi:hypothetical protein